MYANGAYGFETAEDMERAFKGEAAAHMYSRSSNPTVENLELRVKAVTGASGVLALSSGMAAIHTTILTLCDAGDNIVTSNHLFGNSWSLFASTLASVGIQARFVNLLNMDEVRKNIDTRTRAIFFETITNPHTEVVDVMSLSKLAKEKQVLLIGDTTMSPLHLFRAREWGINIEIISSSKIISGGGTSIGGLVIDYASFDYSSLPKLREFSRKFGPYAFYAKLRKEVFRNTGSCMSPFNAYLQSLGLESLPLRFERSASSALAVAQFLEAHPAVTSVNYPGLKSSPFNAIATKQFGEKPTSLLSFNLKSREACFSFLNNLKLLKIATNLMDNRTLIMHPGSTIYVEYTQEQRMMMDVPDTLIRLSVGIEEVDDLVEDLSQALPHGLQE